MILSYELSIITLHGYSGYGYTLGTILIKYNHHSKGISAHLDVFYISGELQCHFKAKFINLIQSVLKL